MEVSLATLEVLFSVMVRFSHICFWQKSSWAWLLTASSTTDLNITAVRHGRRYHSALTAKSGFQRQHVTHILFEKVGFKLWCETWCPIFWKRCCHIILNIFTTDICQNMTFERLECAFIIVEKSYLGDAKNIEVTAQRTMMLYFESWKIFTSYKSQDGSAEYFQSIHSMIWCSSSFF